MRDTVLPRVMLSQERVAYLQQQMLKEEEMAVAAKSRLEEAQTFRVAAEEELAKQELLFADTQVARLSSCTMLDAARLKCAELMPLLMYRSAFKKPIACLREGARCTRA